MKIFQIRICDKSGQAISLMGPEPSMLEQFSELIELLNQIDIDGITKKTIEVSGYLDSHDRACYKVVIPIDSISWATILDMYQTGAV